MLNMNKNEISSVMFFSSYCLLNWFRTVDGNSFLGAFSRFFYIFMTDFWNQYLILKNYIAVYWMWTKTIYGYYISYKKATSKYERLYFMEYV